MQSRLEYPDNLLKLVQIGHGSEDILEQLLDAFYNGLDLEQLRKLLRSDNSSAVKDAAWILSELGKEASPLIDECNHLIMNENKSVRFDALDVILVNATNAHKDLIAKALHLLTDEESGVRWKCLNFTTRLSDDQLAAALSSEYLSDLKSNVAWLIRQKDNKNSADINRMISSQEYQDRTFGVIAAARGGVSYAPLLKVAAESADDAVSRFAADKLEDLALSVRPSKQN